MYIDLTLAGVQVLLIALKLTGQYTRSWWLVLMPTIIWAVGVQIIERIMKGGDST